MFRIGYVGRKYPYNKSFPVRLLTGRETCLRWSSDSLAERLRIPSNCFFFLNPTHRFFIYKSCPTPITAYISCLALVLGVIPLIYGLVRDRAIFLTCLQRYMLTLFRFFHHSEKTITTSSRHASSIVVRCVLMFFIFLSLR